MSQPVKAHHHLALALHPTPRMLKEEMGHLWLIRRYGLRRWWMYNTARRAGMEIDYSQVFSLDELALLEEQGLSTWGHRVELCHGCGGTLPTAGECQEQWYVPGVGTFHARCGRPLRPGEWLRHHLHRLMHRPPRCVTEGQVSQ
jgi:hypothetical protein